MTDSRPSEFSCLSLLHIPQACAPKVYGTKRRKKKKAPVATSQPVATRRLALFPVEQATRSFRNITPLFTSTRPPWATLKPKIALGRNLQVINRPLPSSPTSYPVSRASSIHSIINSFLPPPSISFYGPPAPTPVFQSAVPT